MQVPPLPRPHASSRSCPFSLLPTNAFENLRHCEDTCDSRTRPELYNLQRRFVRYQLHSANTFIRPIVSTKQRKPQSWNLWPATFSFAPLGNLDVSRRICIISHPFNLTGLVLPDAQPCVLTSRMHLENSTAGVDVWRSELNFQLTTCRSAIVLPCRCRA